MKPYEKKPRANYTINDIAEYTGLSRSTVSRVINKSKNVSESAEKKVLDAIETLGYVPNMIARGLRLQAKIIGVIVQDILNPYYIEALYEIEKLCKAHGYALLNMNSDSNPTMEQENLYQMLSMQVQGIILIGNILDETNRMVKLALQDTQLICMEGIIKGADNIIMEPKESIYQMVEHLISFGHKTFGLAHHATRSYPIRMREHYFRKALVEHGILEENIVTYYGDDYLEQLTQAARQQTLPTALFTLNDSTAITIYRWCQEQNLKIPDDISIIGFDNVKTYDMVMPSLTTINQPIGRAAERAAQILLDRIEQKETEKQADPYLVNIDTAFIPRGSTGPAPLKATKVGI